MPIRYVKLYTTELLQNNPESKFVFGDNGERAGYGGQAAVCRDAPNTIGVATLHRLGVPYGGDHDLAAWKLLIQDLKLVEHYATFHDNCDVVAPIDGIGTGIAGLPTRCPIMHAFIVNFFHSLPGEPCPWPRP